MCKAKPMFSIIMPTYNSERFVLEAVESVLGQGVDSWELLIVDDASEDDTRRILEGIELNEPRVRAFYRETNGGPAVSRNMAISRASGRFIAFLDSDDVWREDKLERQLELFAQTGTPLAYSAYEKVSESGDRIGRVVQVPPETSYRDLLGATVIATCTAVYDTMHVGKVLMPDIRKRQDFGLWLRILRGGGVAKAVNEPLAYLRKRAGSLSSNKLSAAYYVWRVYRELEKLSLLESTYYFSKYAYHASVKARI
jgi:teichuronic acid biosynthesis glycosyltransferase TuaG